MKKDDVIWVCRSYSRPGNYKFIAQNKTEVVVQDYARPGVRNLPKDYSFEIVRAKDVFATEREALEVTLKRAEAEHYFAGQAVETYGCLLKKVANG